MLVVQLLIEKERVPLEVMFRVPGEDQLNRSCGLRLLKVVLRKDPKPSTSSISCSVVRKASKLPPGGRVNANDTLEFRVTIPSNVPLTQLKVPSAQSAPAVSKPRARPFALANRMFVERGFGGRLVFAVLSFEVFASMVNAFLKLFQS